MILIFFKILKSNLCYLYSSCILTLKGWTAAWINDSVKNNYASRKPSTASVFGNLRKMSTTPFSYLHDHLAVGGKQAVRAPEPKPRFRGEDSLMERKSHFKVVQAHECMLHILEN